MLGAIRYNLANLLNANGRDARQTFWYYVLFIVIVRFIASTVMSVPLMVRTVGAAVHAAQQGSDPAAAQAQMMASMIDILPRMMWFGIAVGVVSAALLLASFVRRLHDSDLGGWWAALPLGLHAYALTLIPAQMDKAITIMAHIDARTQPDPMAMMRGQGGAALIAWAPILLVVGLAVRATTPGPNRFGEAPVSF